MISKQAADGLQFRKNVTSSAGLKLFARADGSQLEPGGRLCAVVSSEADRPLPLKPRSSRAAERLQSPLSDSADLSTADMPARAHDHHDFALSCAMSSRAMAVARETSGLGKRERGELTAHIGH